MSALSQSFTSKSYLREVSQTAMADKGDVRVFKLAVSSGGCSGVYWRGDPYTGASPPDNSDWPRNGALLRGILHEVNGKEHLQVSAQVPKGGSAWQPVADGKWMPSNGGASNGGQWLHAPDGDIPEVPPGF